MNTVQRFTKKPVTIEAIQFLDDLDTINAVAAFAGNAILPNAGRDDNGMAYLFIATLEGEMRANAGDWIIKGVNGEFYPCKPDIFEKTYEPAKEPMLVPLRSRLLADTQKLAADLNELNGFMASPAFPKLDRPEKDLLYEQQRTMSRLVQILGQRLEFHAMPFHHPTP